MQNISGQGIISKPPEYRIQLILMLMDGIDPCIRRVWMFLEVRYCIEINKDTVSKECEFSTFKENGKLVSVIHCISNDGHRNFLYYNLQ